MSETVMVSVVIPTFGRSEPLRRALKSVRHQKYKDYEIIVVDDNVTLDSQNSVQNICSEFDAYYLKNSGTKGGCGARNTGALNSSGKYLAFLDDDDCWFDNKLVEQIRFMESLGSHASFSGFFIYYETQSLAVESIKNRSKDVLTHNDILQGSCPATTSLAVVRRDVFLAIGLFDVSLPSFQDYDLWLRISDYGEIHYLEMALVVFTFHSGDRVSVNLNRRFSGLEMIVKKWQSELSSSGNLKLIKQKFRAAAYDVNALTLSDTAYFKSIEYRILSIYEYPLNARSYVHLLLNILGGDIYWAIRKMRNAMPDHLNKKINYLYNVE